MVTSLKIILEVPKKIKEIMLLSGINNCQGSDIDFRKENKIKSDGQRKSFNKKQLELQNKLS